ncbi:hypothetical protein P175DRAFT_0380027 [Aspergillus ochraceoroseus IBT 24754]|uniref:Uncharacterized protein n=1 Tax=Aspergillus ochraceoroseus IBT 24754 TaxID=1392256 RepID=A0A2T5LNI2_9EURO|nr:uncharacterized protein P175DRAFT_0380027 [Aspergillus ochraceoroseus IBT 24754]PTU17835.1 hypothetical protein P175DRAFT_0380027 [Aspergillus ochraceoroseus IBT 24754]
MGSQTGSSVRQLLGSRIWKPGYMEPSKVSWAFILTAVPGEEEHVVETAQGHLTLYPPDLWHLFDPSLNSVVSRNQGVPILPSTEYSVRLLVVFITSAMLYLSKLWFASYWIYTCKHVVGFVPLWL